MVEEIVILDSETHQGLENSEAVELYSQQLWCWGRDILRSEGNWLIQKGFDGLRAPAEKAGCKNIYSISLSETQSVMLRGFGIIYSDEELGTMFLPRSNFKPKYTSAVKLTQLPWEFSDLSELQNPIGEEQKLCLKMLDRVIDWIIEYEKEIQEQLGVEYRKNTLNGWDNGKRKVFPARQIIPMWIKIRNDDYEEL